jgi:hypothetical protein
MTNLEHGLRRINDHLAQLREQTRGLPLRGSVGRQRLRELEALASTAGKRVSEARAAVETALRFIHDHQPQPPKTVTTSMRTTIAASILLALSSIATACGPIVSEGGTDSTTMPSTSGGETSTSIGEVTTMGDVSTTGEVDETTTTTTSTGEVTTSTSTGEVDSTSSTSGDDPAPYCTHLAGDLDAVVCEQCIGEDCCWALPVGVCLEPCEQAGPLSCDKGFSCHTVVTEEPVGVCWPDFGDEDCYPLNDDPMALVCQRCDLFGDAACCWVAHNEPNTCLSQCDEDVCAEGSECRSATTDVGAQANVCWPL